MSTIDFRTYEILAGQAYNLAYSEIQRQNDRANQSAVPNSYEVEKLALAILNDLLGYKAKVRSAFFEAENVTIS